MFHNILQLYYNAIWYIAAKFKISVRCFSNRLLFHTFFVDRREILNSYIFNMAYIEEKITRNETILNVWQNKKSKYKNFSS